MTKLHKTIQAPTRQPRALNVAPFEGFDRTANLAVQQEIIDDQLAGFTEGELKVLLYVLRHTFCLGVPDEVMPMARLVENTGLSLRHTRLAVTALAARGLILVQHRQDAERGKLPSRFGVKVIGEAAPFSSIPG